MRDVDAFEGAYGRLAATRVASAPGRLNGPRPSPPSERRPSTALSPLLRRLALLAPSHRVPRGARD